MRRVVLLTLAVLALGAAVAGYHYGPPRQWLAAVWPGVFLSPGEARAAATPRDARPAGGGSLRQVGAGVPVETSLAHAANVTTDIRAVGSLQSDESVKLAPEVSGRIAAIPFREGTRVSVGDVILKLDDALARAELADAEARFKLAEANMQRTNELVRTGTATGRARDEAVSSFGIAAAAVELARVRVAKHTITAPFSGVVGLRNISVGAYLGVGDTVVNLEKIDLLKVDFSVPEIHLGNIAVGQDIDVTVDAILNRTFAGTIDAIDPMVDVNGRSLTIRAHLPNPDGVLRPGLFARINVRGLVDREVVMVPESAVVPRGGETFIFRVEDGRAVESRITLGERRNGEVAILDGLMPGATVVTAGHQRLRDGVVVDVVSAGAAMVPQGG